MRQTVAPQICANLGVNLAAMEVKAELYKLLVYEEGSQSVVSFSLSGRDV